MQWTKRLSEDSPQESWRRCCSLSSGSSGQDINPGIMGRLRNWSTLSLHSCPWDCFCYWTGQIQGPPSLPCLHWLWYCLIFQHKGKKTGWDTCKAFEEVTDTFLALSTGPSDISEAHVSVLERFTILLYDMIAQAVRMTSMRPGNSCLPRKGVLWMSSLPLRQYCSSISRGQRTREAIAG